MNEQKKKAATDHPLEIEDSSTNQEAVDTSTTMGSTARVRALLVGALDGALGSSSASTRNLLESLLQELDNSTPGKRESPSKTVMGGSLTSKAQEIFSRSKLPTEINEGASNNTIVLPESVGISFGNPSIYGVAPKETSEHRAEVSEIPFKVHPKSSDSTSSHWTMNESSSCGGKGVDKCWLHSLPTCRGSTTNFTETIDMHLICCNEDIPVDYKPDSPTCKDGESNELSGGLSNDEEESYENNSPLLKIQETVVLPSFTVQSPVAMVASSDGSVKIDSDTVDMSSSSCNAGMSIQKEICDWGSQTEVLLNLDTDPFIMKYSSSGDVCTVESRSLSEVKEHDLTSDSNSNSRLSLSVDELEAANNPTLCGRRSESPSTTLGGSLASKGPEINSRSKLPTEMMEGGTPLHTSAMSQGLLPADVNETNMQFESVEYSPSMTSQDGEVRNKTESLVMNKTQVTVTTADVARNPNETKMSKFKQGSLVAKAFEFSLWSKLPNEVTEGESHLSTSAVTQGLPLTDINKTNIQLESAACSLSNTSCDGEEMDDIKSASKNKTQVSTTSLDVCKNPTDRKESRLSMLEGNVSEIGDCPSYTVQSPVSLTSLDGSIKIDLETANFSSFSCNAGTSTQTKTCDCGAQTKRSLELDTNPIIRKSSRYGDFFTVELLSPNEVKEQDLTGDSNSNSRLSLSADEVEGSNNPNVYERRSKSPSTELGGSLASKGNEINSRSKLPTEIMEGSWPLCTSVSQGLLPADVNETNMQFESVEYSSNKTSCDGEVPNKVESLTMNKTKVSVTTEDVARNPVETKSSTFKQGSLVTKDFGFSLWSKLPNEVTEGESHLSTSAVTQGLPIADVNKTNIQLESAACSLSNTSCDGEEMDDIKSASKDKTQVSTTSLDVCKNPTDRKESRSSMLERNLLGIGDCPSYTVQSPVPVPSLDGSIKIDLEIADLSSFSFNAGTSTQTKTFDCGTQTTISLELDTNPFITKSSSFDDFFTVESPSLNEVREQDSTGDSNSNSRLSLSVDEVEASNNPTVCERRSESPSINTYSHDDWTLNLLPNSPGLTRIDLGTTGTTSFCCNGAETSEMDPSCAKSSSFVAKIATGLENSKVLSEGKRRKLNHSAPEHSAFETDEPSPKVPCLAVETEEDQAKFPGKKLTMEHPPAKDMGEPTNAATLTGKERSSQAEGKCRKRKRSSQESSDTSGKESVEPLRKSQCLFMETNEPQFVSPPAEEPAFHENLVRVKVENPTSPEALEFAHLCLRNAYHALLDARTLEHPLAGMASENVTIQPQVVVEPAKPNRGRRNRIKRVWNGESFVPEAEVRVQSEPYKRKRRRRRRN